MSSMEANDAAGEGDRLLANSKNLEELEKLKRERNANSGIGLFPLIFLGTFFLYKMGIASKAILILVSCMSFAGLLLHMATHEYPNKEGTKGSTLLERLLGAVIGQPVADNESMSDMITRFRVDSTNIKESHLLLLRLRKKLLGDHDAAEDAVKLGLVKFVLRFAQDNSSLDKRVPVAMDIVTTILSRPKAKDALRSNDSDMRDVIDTLVQCMHEHMITDETLAAVTAKEVNPSADEASKEEDKGTGPAPSDEEIEYDFSDQSDKKIAVPNQYFLKFGHKFAMSLGMLADEHKGIQTMIGDRGGINVIVNCLRQCRATPAICKWSCWAILNFVYEHPPNKRDFFIRGGLGYTIDAMNKNPSVLDLYQQGLALILTIISTDNDTKMSLAKARESCLANGVFDMLQNGKKAFVDDSSVQEMIKRIFDLLMADWS